MLPPLTTNDNADLGLFYAELGSDANLRPSLGVEGSYLEHLFIGQPSIDVSSARGSGQPALGLAIQHIVFGCSDEQMIRIGTGRVVAAMTDVHAFWDRPSVNFIRKAMGLVQSDRSVTFSVDWATPSPAAVRLASEDNVRPIECHGELLGKQPLDGSHVFRVHAAQARAGGSQRSWRSFWVGFLPKRLARVYDKIRAVAQDWDSAMLGVAGPYPAWRVGGSVDSGLNQQEHIIAYHGPMISWTVA